VDFSDLNFWNFGAAEHFRPFWLLTQQHQSTTMLHQLCETKLIVSINR